MFHHPAWAVGSYSSGHQPGELPKSKSTQPRFATRWATLYCHSNGLFKKNCCFPCDDENVLEADECDEVWHDAHLGVHVEAESGEAERHEDGAKGGGIII